MSATQDDRPTFGTYWRKNRGDSMAKSLVFVQSDPSQANGKASEKTEESEQSARNKRRAQVRKAQIQHRARKANYTKQLEADVAAIREQIEDADRERRMLRTENQAIRAQLSGPQQTSAAAEYANPGGFYTTTPTSSYLQAATGSYGFDVNSISLDYLDVTDAGLNGMLDAPSMCHNDGSPAYASSSTESSGLFGSPQYMDSGNSTPYPPFYEMNLQDQSHQVMNYTSGFP